MIVSIYMWLVWAITKAGNKRSLSTVLFMAHILATYPVRISTREPVSGS